MSDVTPVTPAPPVQAPRPAPRPKPEAKPEAKPETKPAVEDTHFPHVRAEIEAGRRALDESKNRFSAEQEAGRKAVEMYQKRNS